MLNWKKSAINFLVISLIAVLAIMFMKGVYAAVSDSDGDGVRDGQDRCGNTPITSPVDYYGCSCEQKASGDFSETCEADDNPCTSLCGGPSAQCNYPNLNESSERIDCPASECINGLLYSYPDSVPAYYCAGGQNASGECTLKISYSKLCLNTTAVINTTNITNGNFTNNTIILPNNQTNQSSTNQTNSSNGNAGSGTGNQYKTCTDTDGGFNINVKGEVKQCDYVNETPTCNYYGDACESIDSDVLIENYCTAENKSTKLGYTCENGCDNEACVSLICVTCAEPPLNCHYDNASCQNCGTLVCGGEGPDINTTVNETTNTTINNTLNSYHVIINSSGNYVMKMDWYKTAGDTWISVGDGIFGKLLHTANSGDTNLSVQIDKQFNTNTKLVLTDWQDHVEMLNYSYIINGNNSFLIMLRTPLKYNYSAGSDVKQFALTYHYSIHNGDETNISLGWLNKGDEIYFSHFTYWKSLFNFHGRDVFPAVYSYDPEYYEVRGREDNRWNFLFDDGVRFDFPFNDGNFEVYKVNTMQLPSAQLTLSTLKDNYETGEIINLTDPPLIINPTVQETMLSPIQFSNSITGNAINSLNRITQSTNFDDASMLYQNKIDYLNNQSNKTLEYNGYIVKFKKQPITEKKVNLENNLKKQKLISALSVSDNSQIETKLAAYKTEIDAEHSLAKADISQKLSKSLTNKITGEFTKTFNGIALDITDAEAQQLKSSPYVEEVYPNYKVYATLMDSVPLIGANQVWQMNSQGTPCIEYGGTGECLTGKGITIAVIDTGVDYNHPDLGGCFGPECKVEGGYDFVNNDFDPMDDQGHGTHVASTAAGNGILKGVAPSATIYAYKVLSAGGSGSSSDIIQAIERSVDPNNDGNFTDHLDIISMSLGGSGTPDDPLSQAVDNAVDNGVIAVIAAGNSGQFNTPSIGSPGNSRKAITVGATYNKHSYNYYSKIKLNITVGGSMGNTDYFESIPVLGSMPTNANYQLHDWLDAGTGTISNFTSKNFTNKIALIYLDGAEYPETLLERAIASNTYAVIFYFNPYSNKITDYYFPLAYDIEIPSAAIATNDITTLFEYTQINQPISLYLNISLVTNDTNVDEVTYFSSQGPSFDEFYAIGIKPEIVAPGYDICAALTYNGVFPKYERVCGQGHTPLSGTSMATPHVSGASALLKQAHPDWGNKEIKSALMISSTPLGENPNIFGAGRINVTSALHPRIYLSEPTLNFGHIEFNDEKLITFTIKNLFPGQTIINLNFSSVDSNVQLIVSPNVANLNPNEEEQVTVHLKYLHDEPPYLTALTNYLTIQGDANAKIPLLYYKTTNKSIVGFTQDPGEISSSLVPFFKTIKLSDINNDEHIEMLGGSSVLYSFNDFENNISNYDILYAPPCIDQGIYCYADSIDAIAVEDFNHDGDKEILVGGTQGYLRLLGKNYNPKNLTKTIVGSENFTFGDYNFTTSINQYNQLIIFARNVDNPLLVAFFNLRISENEYDSEYGYIENIIFHLVSLQNGIAIVKLQENGYKPTLLNKFREQLWAMDSADFNNDGWQDVVFSYSPLPRVLNISILFNDGHGNLNNLYTIYTSGDQISGLTAGDVDNDGFKDVVVGYSTAFSRFNVYGVTKLLKNDGNNQFYDGGVISAYGTGTPLHPENDINPRVVLSDLDNDGNLELVIGDNSGKIRILKKDSTGKYNEDLLVNKGLLFDFGRLSWGVAANDINNDGKIDLVIASGLRYYYNAFLLYTKLNNGDFITPAPVRPKSQIINNGTINIIGYLFMGIEKLSGISVSASDIKKLGNENFLEIGEAINAPQPVLNQNDLISLSNGTFMNARGIFPYTQELTLPSAKTVFAVDSGQSEDPSMYLKFNSNEPAYIYNLRFNPALESEVNENLELKDLTGHRLNLFAKEFTIISAKNESDRLTLKLFHASLVDVLQEGETETYSYNGNDYEITASYISTSGALFTVNGRTTDRLIEGDIYTLADGTNIGVIDITNNSENGMDVVEFGLGSESLKITDYHPLTANWDAEVAYGNEDLNNVKADIIVTSFSNGITKIRELRFKYLPSSDLFVPMSGELSTTAYDEEGEDGNVLVNGFDIEFKGIDEEDNLWEKIEIERAADFSYRLSFENRNGDLYEIPVWSYDNLTNSIKLGYNADSFKKLVITEGTSILDEEIFVLSNDAAKKTHFFQFKSVNTNDQTFKIKDLMENGATIEANNASAFIFDGTAYYAYYTGSGSNARLYIDLNGDGTIQQGQRADRLYTKYSDSDGYIQLIPDNASINASGIFLTEKTQNMPSNNFQEQIKWKFYFDSSLNKLMLSNPVNDFGSFSPMKKMSSLDKYIGITYYGADGEYDYTNSDSPSLKFNYPDKQLEMWINVVGNMPEQTSHSFWQPYRIVIEDLQPRTVPANNVQALDTLWNANNVKLNESGQYRVVGEFRDSYSGQPIQTTAGYLRDEWEFNVSEAVSPTPLKLNVTITNPLNNSIVNSNPVVFSATTSKIAYCNIMYKEYLNNYSVGGAGPMFSSNKLQHSSSLSFHQGGHVVANVNCISAVNQSEYANANIEFSVNFIDICGNNFCNADAGETPENCPIDCRHVDYPEYCQQNNMGNNVGSNNEQGNSGNSLSIAAKTNFDTLSNETLKKIVVQGDIQKFKSLGLSIQMNSPGIFSITSKFQRIDVMQQKLPEVAALRDIEGNEFIVNLAAVFNEQYAKGYIVEFDGLPIVEYQKQLESDIQGMKIQADLLKQKIDARTGTSKIFNIIDVPRLSIAKNSINNAEIQLPNKISEHKNELKTNIASFREEIIKIDKSINETSKVKEEYKMVFNGVFLDASAKTAMEIEDMKGVKSIRANKKVNVILDESAKVINADDVWKTIDNNGYNITGKGVKVAVIDTGVDYTHSDLGGCFGPGCKVAGGYDFINNDNEPMDDHGHGTHVAATIGGINPVLKGIAPDAIIYAYKVLDASGSGGSNGIISAMEYSADPNQDGNTSDHMDIASLSLGGRGDPDDPMSRAVDAATDAGILFVIAAGNSGPSPGSIGSPGTARSALTVAASDKCDNLAGFSSRGPVTWNNGTLLKPDIMAPGVNICAAEYDSWLSDRRCMDDEHIAISGTSMATPHVSGVAALLKQKYPNLSPAELKSLLKQTSYNLGYTQFEQGNGRLDAKRAIESRLIVTPSSFYDDFTEKTQTTWTLNIENMFNAQTFVTIKYPNPRILDLHDGTPLNHINITIAGPTNLDLEASSTQSFNINVSGLPNDFEGYLLGEIQISDGQNVNTVPYLISTFSKLIVYVNENEIMKDYSVFAYRDDLGWTSSVSSNDKIADGVYKFNKMLSGNYSIAIAGDTLDWNNEYFLFGRAHVPMKGTGETLINFNDARLFTIKARSLNNTPLFLVQWEKRLEYRLPNGESATYTMSDPNIGDRKVYLTNKPEGGPDLNIIFDYIGVPYTAP